MTTENEAMRLLKRADPAPADDAAPAIDAAGYLDALRTRSSNVAYIDAEPTPTEPPTHRHRWLAAAAAAAPWPSSLAGSCSPPETTTRRGARPTPGPVTEQPAVTEGPVTTPPALATTPAVDDAGTRVGFIGLPPDGATPSSPEGEELVVEISFLRIRFQISARSSSARSTACRRSASSESSPMDD